MLYLPTLSASLSPSGRAKNFSVTAKVSSTRCGGTPWLATTRNPVSSQVRAMARASGAAAPAAPARYAAISSTGMRPWPEGTVLAAARLMSVASVDRAPDALRRDGHVEVFDAEFGERVDDRVDDRAERRRRAPFAAAAQPERVRRRGHFAELGHERWQCVRARQRVVHQRRGGELTSRLVVRADRKSVV